MGITLLRIMFKWHHCISYCYKAFPSILKNSIYQIILERNKFVLLKCNNFKVVCPASDNLVLILTK